MQKWEYMVVDGNSWPNAESRVDWVNGNRAFKLIEKRGIFSGGTELQGVKTVWDFLNMLGNEGWEVVSVISTTDDNDKHRYILKRPKQ
jgi:hypothetical protein